MMRHLATVILCLFALASYGQAADTSAPAKPKTEKTKKKKTPKVRVPKPDQHVKETVYLFGFSSQLGDSLHYITSIVRLDSVDMTKKTRFMSYRDSYSYQLRVYLEGTLHKKNQTTAIFFDTKLKRVQKMYDKMISRHLNVDGVKLVTINPDDFTFTSVEHGLTYGGS